MSRNRSAVVALCSLGLAGIATAVFGGVSAYPSDQELLAAKGNVVAAVTVEDVRPAVGTRGHPPRVSLRIDTLIRGSIRERRLEAVWSPPDYHGVVEGDFLPPASWLAEPLAAPTPGTRLILLLSRDGNGFRVSNRCRYPDTPRVREQVRKGIRDYIAWERRWRREWAKDAQAERARLGAQLRSWRARATPALIAQATREADFIGIGRLSSGPNDRRADFEITEILKGPRREHQRDSAYFASVTIPAAASDVFEESRGQPEVLLFLAENGMDLDSDSYPLVGVGLIPVDAEARKTVRETLARTPQPPPLPLCVVMIVGYAGRLSADGNEALKARIADVFTDAGRGRCIVGRSGKLSSLHSPEWAGDKIRELFRGTRAVLVSIDNKGGARLSGIRIGPEDTTVVFSDAPWPAGASDQQETARRLLGRLVAAK